MIDEKDILVLKNKILSSGLSISQLVSAAWASASTYRDSDKRGGTNGGRVRLHPQRNWEVNNPAQLATLLQKLEGIQNDLTLEIPKVSQFLLQTLLFLVVVRQLNRAADEAGYEMTVPFKPGRADASQQQTDVASFDALEPKADGFRNYQHGRHNPSAEEMLVDKAQLLTLTAPEMTVLVGGMRVLNANFDQGIHGVLTTRPGILTMISL